MSCRSGPRCQGCCSRHRNERPHWAKLARGGRHSAEHFNAFYIGKVITKRWTPELNCTIKLLGKNSAFSGPLLCSWAPICFTKKISAGCLRLRQTTSFDQEVIEVEQHEDKEHHVGMVHFSLSAWTYPVVLGLADAGPWDVVFSVLLMFLNFGALVIGCYWLAGVGTSFESKSCPVVIHRFWICEDLGEPWLNQLARHKECRSCFPTSFWATGLHVEWANLCKIWKHTMLPYLLCPTRYGHCVPWWSFSSCIYVCPGTWWQVWTSWAKSLRNRSLLQSSSVADPHRSFAPRDR